MKLFFELPRAGHERIPGISKAWEAFVSSMAEAQSEHSVTDHRQSADAIIHTSAAQLDASTIRTLLKPLSSDDVAQLVWDWEDWPTGRMSGFYCSLKHALYDPRRHRATCYPIMFNELVDAFAPDDARYDFGFIGAMTAGVRQRVIATFYPTQRQDNSIIRAQGGVWSEACARTGNQSKADYAEFLRRTRFILCPRGFGVGSARLFETLKAGRVPIIISDGYILPAGIDWDSCSIMIKEGQIGRIREVVKSNMDRWPAMSRNARAVWEANFADDKLLAYLGSNIQEIRDAAPKVGLSYKTEYATRMAAAIVVHHARPKIGLVRKALMDRLAAG
jgi:hypothetical protein